MTAVLGVLGGMGPLASAHFLRNVYELNARAREQDLPRVLVDSDPTIPDRTAAIMTGHTDPVRQRLTERLGGLRRSGATTMVVPCYTAHHFLAQLDPTVRASVLSLVDVTIRQLMGGSGRLLMLSTAGSRRARIFELATGWPAVAHRVVLPDAADQERIHRLIYQIKRDGTAGASAVVDALLRRSGCAGVVVACTEFHLLSRELGSAYGAQNVVDALLTIAADIDNVLHGRGDWPAVPAHLPHHRPSWTQGTGGAASPNAP